MSLDCVSLRGKTIHYLSTDTSIGKTLSIGKYWDEELVPLLAKHIDPHKDCLDIGAFIGTTTLLMSEFCTHGQIHTFEPVYSDICRLNIESNGLQSQVCLHEVALGNAQGHLAKQPVNRNEERNFGGVAIALLHDKPLENQLLKNEAKTTETIPIRTLDSFAFDNVGFVKIDVEGFELQVLQGSVETLKRNNHPPVLIEIWDVVCWRKNFANYYAHNKAAIIQLLEGLGYTKTQIDQENYLFVKER